MQQSQSLLCFSWVILRFGVEVVVSAASTRMAAASAEAPWGCSQRSGNNLGCPFHSGCGLLPTSRLVPISPHKKMTSVAGLPYPTSLKARPLCPHCVARDSCSDYSSRSCMLSSYREEKHRQGSSLRVHRPCCQFPVQHMAFRSCIRPVRGFLWPASLELETKIKCQRSD